MDQVDPDKGGQQEPPGIDEVGESEADQICTALKTAIFSSDLEKIEKIHLRYFIERIDLVANRAEDIADALTIYSLKRMV